MFNEAEWILEKASDPRSNDEILEELRVSADDTAYSDLLTILQARRDPELIREAIKLCKSREVTERKIGVDILAQNGAGRQKILQEECVEALLDRIMKDEDSDVLAYASFALDDYIAPRISPSLAKLKNHSDAEVRYAVVHGLLTREDKDAIETLIKLTVDQDRNVRNWATFGLAQQIDTDTPEIREALIRRLDDKDAEIRGEALVGLAVRDDARVIKPLVRELRTILETEDDYYDLAFEAAMEIGDARLYPELIALKEDGVENSWLDEAIATCRVPSPEDDEEPDESPTTCPVCGLKNAFPDPESDYCARCGWTQDAEQRLNPDSTEGSNRRSLNQERERWRKRLETAKRKC